MILKIAIPLYTLLLIVAVIFKAKSVQKQIGKNPVLIQQMKSSVETYLKIAGLLFFPLWIGGMIFFAFAPGITSRVPGLTLPTWTGWAGLTFLFLSLGLFVLALIHLKEAWRIGIDLNQTNQLITNGIYGFIRHPIYTSFKIAQLGALLLFPNLYFLMICSLAFVGFSIMGLLEEDFLRKRFGKDYEDYRMRTGAFYPKLF